ncbi:hypothetical protein [Chlorogloea sp. CCALA 695]
MKKGNPNVSTAKTCRLMQSSLGGRFRPEDFAPLVAMMKQNP